MYVLVYSFTNKINSDSKHIFVLQIHNATLLQRPHSNANGLCYCQSVDAGKTNKSVVHFKRKRLQRTKYMSEQELFVHVKDFLF